MMKTVYLAGPIMGCTKTEAKDWRYDFDRRLADHDIRGVSPLRCEPLVGERYEMQYLDPKFGTNRAIGAKNLFDVRSCDMTLAYLPMPIDGEPQSYGTIIELAWAYALHKPTILVTDDPYVRDHPLIDACTGWLLNNFDDALEVIIGVLGGYTIGGKNI